LLDDQPIALTYDAYYSLQDLNANTTYAVRIQHVTAYGDSIVSEPTHFSTDEQCERIESMAMIFYTISRQCLVPTQVINLHVVRTSMTAVRIAWESPNPDTSQSFKGYQIYLGSFIGSNKKNHICLNNSID
jgi:hypothetical protein